MKTTPDKQIQCQVNSESISRTIGINMKGLTKREYFAALAMQGLLSAQFYKGADDDHIANWSVNVADRLISELNMEPAMESNN